MHYFFYKNRFGGGFSNQIIFLIDHLQSIHLNYDQSIIFVDHLINDDYVQDSGSPMSSIIDLDWLNNFFFKNIIIIDIYSLPNDLQFSFSYNDNHIMLDSQLLIAMIKYNQCIYELLPNLTDPCVGKQKQFNIYIPSKGIDMSFIELCGLLRGISISNEKGKGIYIMNNKDIIPIFNYIPFKLSIKPYPSIFQYINRNVVHLRNETDAIRFWGNSKDNYENELNEKYIHFITTYIHKTDDITIILTFQKENNPVIEWMKKNEYNIYLHTVNETQRERCAAYELSLATEFCNNVLIGYQQSSFSKWLKIRCNYKLCIDI